MQSSYPDSPEACALALFELIYRDEKASERGRNEPTARWAIDLFADCLAAVKGEPRAAGSAMMH